MKYLFTAEQENAVRILLALDGAKKPVAVSTVAKKLDASRDFIEQVCLLLRRHGLVESTRGVMGGYMLKRPLEDITLLQALSAKREPMPFRLRSPLLDNELGMFLTCLECVTVAEVRDR